MTYPDGIDALVNVNATDSLAAGGHAARHNSVNTALGEVKDFLGTGTGYRYNSTVYFTSNGTFTKATYPWLRAIRVRVVGGGGGGGGTPGSIGATRSVASGGGGAGGYAEKFITNIAGLSASETITVGASGTGGTGANDGTGGGTTTAFGLTGNGGNGGISAPNEDLPTGIHGDAGGIGSSGDLNFRGQAGGAGYGVKVNRAFGGIGGASYFGGGGMGGRFDANGDSGGAFGAGGGGASTVGAVSNTAKTGGAGSAGIVIVELYA
jgi:hypothetical protein